MYKKAPELVPVGWVEQGGMSIALPVGYYFGRILLLL
jgi:hypothetical protein